MLPLSPEPVNETGSILVVNSGGGSCQILVSQSSEEDLKSIGETGPVNGERLKGGEEKSSGDSHETGGGKLPLHRKLWDVKAILEMKCLWDEFNDLGTEMIVTKAGR